jgi:hypothetical protein
MSTKSVRFVGGPWHNRIEEVELIPRIIVQRVLPQTTMSYAGCFSAANIKRDSYYLAKYFTTWGTDYVQYVHSTLIQGTRAASGTHLERFRVWKLDQRQLDARLRRAMNAARNNH